MANRLPLALFLKSIVVNSPLELPAKRIRWWLSAGQRRRYPELYEFYLEERWLPEVLKRILTSESCGVDVGCHIGSFLSQIIKYAPQGNHIAFEPSQIKGAWLKRRFKNVEINICAIADKPGTAIFEENLKRPGLSRIANSSASGGEELDNSYQVDVRCLDEILLEKDRVDFIKFDVEGGELAALRGAQKTLDKFRPMVLFECGPEANFQNMSFTSKDLFEFLTQTLGYEILSFSDFIFDRSPMCYAEFTKCRIYPFRAFNFIARPKSV